MTYLLLQTFLLLLSAYFLGAFLACLTKRFMTRRMELAAAHAPRVSATPVVARPLQETLKAKPRSIDPIQPKIDILPRPEPKAAPAQSALDTTRFDRALTGPDPNAGMPRKMIVEIRPAILKPPTVAFEPKKPKEAPKKEAPKEVPKPVATAAPLPQPVPVKPAAVQPAPAQSVPSASVEAAAQAKPTPSPAPVQAVAPAPSAGAAATAAAAAAVAAAKAAAASVSVAAPKPVAPAPQPVMPSTAQPAPAVKAAAPVAQPAPAQPVMAQAAAPKPAAPAPQPAAPQQPAAVQPAVGGDDLQRIRAIDADTERRLHGVGVRRFDDIALWTPADINRINQALGLTGRIDREQWIEQAQILAKGGETYYSRNRAAAARGSVAQPAAAPTTPSPATPTPAAPTASTPAPASAQSVTMAAAAAAAAAAASTVKPAAAAPSPAPQPAPAAASQSAPAAPAPAAVPAASALQGRSVAEMATAAAAAIAAASASVTRGIRPIEPISPMSRANPNLSMPAKLSDALKEQGGKSTPAATKDAGAPILPRGPDDGGDDLKRIRGVGVLIEKRLNALGVSTYDQIANWTSGDIDRISQTLDFKGRIERENWVEQARILSSGGHTEFSRRVDRGDVESSKDPEGA